MLEDKSHIELARGNAGTENAYYPIFPISTLQGVPYSATELLDVAE